MDLGAMYLVSGGADEEDEYIERQYYSDPLGAATDAVTKTHLKMGKVVSAVLLAISCYAAYLCYTSEGLIDVALNRIAPGAGAGSVVIIWRALTAFFSGFTYLIYYGLFKKSRMEALAHLAPK